MQRIPREGESRGWEEYTKRPAKIRANETILHQPVCKPASSGFFTVPFPEIRKSFLTLHKSFNPTREAPFGFLLRFHSFCSPSVFLTIEIRAYSRLRGGGIVGGGGGTKKFRGISREIQSAKREIRERVALASWRRMRRYCSPRSSNSTVASRISRSEIYVRAPRAKTVHISRGIAIEGTIVRVREDADGG